MDLFEKQAQLQSLFQTSPVDAAYAQGTAAGRKLAGSYSDLDVALLLLNRVAQWDLQPAVELLFGTGAYLVSALALPKPEAYHDILDAIAGHGVIERALAYRLEHLANLRNLLAYDREQTDIDDVYGQIQTRVHDLGAFADQVERFVGGGAGLS